MRRRIGLVVLVVSTVSAAGWLASCGGAPPPVSLVSSYTLVDAGGRKSGTVVLSPMGGGELRDVDGTVIGVISAPGGTAPAPAAAPSPEKKP